MTHVAWPLDLPQSMWLNSYQEDAADNLIVDGYEVGPPAYRRRTVANTRKVAGFVSMTADEWESFDEFYRQSLSNGALNFYFPPQGSTGTDYWVARFLDPPARSLLGGETWHVTLNLEILRSEPLPSLLNRFIHASYVADADTFYVPAVESAVQILSPSALSNTNTLYEPTASRGVRSLTVPLYTDPDTFYGAGVVTPGLVIAPQHVDPDTLFAATVSADQALTAIRYDDADTFYAPSASLSGSTLAPSLITDADTFYAPSASVGAAVLTAGLITDADSMYVPSVGGVFESALSLRVNSTSKDLTRTQGTGSSRRKMTFSFLWWCPSTSTQSVIISSASTSQLYLTPSFTTTASPAVLFNSGANGFVATELDLTTNAWNHIVVQIDTANATSTQRVRMWINGVEDTALNFVVSVTQNFDTGWGQNTQSEITCRATTAGGSNAIDEFAKIDNSLLTPSSFVSGGEPLDLSALSFGSQGYWLRFESGVGSTAGNDSSGNGLNFASTYADGDFPAGYPTGL